jgi:beta-glucosidase
MTIQETVECSDALLAVWHLGLSSGTAITETLLGENNPSAKLVTNFPKTIGQIPLYYNHKSTGRPTSRRYVDCDDSPLFPFGFGLSYSEFSYTNLVLKQAILKKKDVLEIQVDLCNESDRDGKEVVQVYYRDRVAQVTRPVKELCAFEKVTLKAHQKKTVTFSIPTSQFGYYTADMAWIVEPGSFDLWVGPNSTQGLSAEFWIR